MNENKLKRLIRIFEETDLDEMEVQHSFWCGTRVKLGRNRGGAMPQAQLVATAGVQPVTKTATVSDAKRSEGSTPDDSTGDLHVIKAPMVGTAYRASAPEEDPFVSVGDNVELGQTICVIEAMKIMNEIEADAKGEIVDILIEDGEPVEFNQPIVNIRPS